MRRAYALPIPPSGHNACMSIPLGNVPTWIAALGTVGALSAALWQINTERKRRIAQETADRAERHQAQARLVAAWVGQPERPESQGEPIGVAKSVPEEGHLRRPRP